MTNERARQAGAMTRAMSAQRGSDDVPRVLRVGILQGTSSLEERIVRERTDVSAGTTERATLTVSTAGFPSHVDLFVVREGRWHLRVERGYDGRVAIGSAVHALDACIASGIAKPLGDAWLVALDEQSRGKVTVAGVTFLFQFAPAPPVAPRAQIPTSLRASLTREMDWRYNATLSCFLCIALGAMTWVEYGYDPIVDDNSDLNEFIARRVHMASLDADTEPVDRNEGAAAETPSNNAPPSSTPARATPRQTPPNHGPTQPSNRDVQRAADRASEATASAFRAMDASFDAITSPVPGGMTAAEQLQNQVLMAGTADDLRNVHGVTTAPSSVSRSNMVASANNVPGSQTLGHTQTTATHDAPGTGTLTGPVGPRRPLTVTPSDPETDTCDGDAGAVARVLRTNLGGIRSCYERASRNNPALGGRLTVRFTVGEAGRASSASVQGVDPELDTCVERAIQRMVFPVPACGAADYQYPITVGPAE